MRKRSKYRPRPIRTDALDYVLTSLKPVRHLQAEIAALRIRNHGALAEVCKGHATQHDITTLSCRPSTKPWTSTTPSSTPSASSSLSAPSNTSTASWPQVKPDPSLLKMR